MEIVRNARGWGNSAGVLLPKEWEGKEVKIILIDRTLEIKREVFDILSNYSEDILGIYLVGSYARKEQIEKSDVDIIAISNKTKKEIVSGKYHINIYTFGGIMRTLKENPIMIYPRLIEAKAILNESLLKELISIKLNKREFRLFIEDCKRIIKISKEFIELDKLDGKDLESTAIICSLVLRLRGIFLIKTILKKEKYSKEKFKKWLGKETKDDIEKIYRSYEIIRDGGKIKEKIEISTAEKLLKLLEKEVGRW